MRLRARKHLTVLAAVGALALLGPGIATAANPSDSGAAVDAPATGLLAADASSTPELGVVPAAAEPASSTATEPVVAQPTTAGPAAEQPTVAEPAAEQPAGSPAAEQPTAAEPATEPAEPPTVATAEPGGAGARAGDTSAQAGAAVLPPVEPDTAAERYGWGTPLPQSDEFDYTGQPNPEKWVNIDGCWAGHDGNGQRCGANSTVDGEKLIQKGAANGDTGWLASTLDQQYGRWEARVRSFNTGDGGNDYHPLLIVWPDSDSWPNDGEYDFLENQAPGEECANAFIHYPHPNMPVEQEFLEESECGAPLSEWHNIAFEWTPDHVRGYIDGKEWYTLSDGAGPGGRANIQGMPSGHLTIQFDNFYGGGMREASYEIDWVRMYTLDPIDPQPGANAGAGAGAAAGSGAGTGAVAAPGGATAVSGTGAPTTPAEPSTAGQDPAAGSDRSDAGQGAAAQGGASRNDAEPSDAPQGDASPSGAAPRDAEPSGAAPSGASPSDAAPSDATQGDAK